MKIRTPWPIVILLILFAHVHGQSARFLFAPDAAFTLRQGRWETSVLQPLRYGCSPGLELSLHPMLFFIMPNAGVKWSHGQWHGWQVSTRHSFYYPSFLLRSVSRKGIGGILAPEFPIPSMLGLHNQILMSQAFDDHLLLTWNLGVGIGLKSGGLDERTTIDLPLIFPRLQIFYHGYNWYSGLDLRGQISGQWQWLLNGQLFFCPRAATDFAFEHKGMLLWGRSARFCITAGYKLIYGEYPFGVQWHLLPMLDLLWGWR